MSLSTLGTHLDAMYLSVYFELPEEQRAMFEKLRELAQLSDDDRTELLDIPTLPGGTWYFWRRGRGKQYRYVMENASFWVAISHYKGTKFPRLDFQFKAATLYEYGADALGELLDRFVRYWFGDELVYEAKVARADVAVDFQQEAFELPELPDVVTRARDRQWSAKYGWWNAVTIGARGGALQAQVYCKSLELEESEKSWMYEVWKGSGDYREDLAVWRAEVRFYREGLHAFGVDTLDQFLESCGDLLDYAIGEESGSWLRICDPETRDQKHRGHHTDRRTASDWWIQVRAAFMEKASRTGRKRQGWDPEPDFKKAVQMAGANLARAAAIWAWTRDADREAEDSGAWAHKVGQIYERMLELKGNTWDDRVAESGKKLRGVAWSPDPEQRPRYRRDQRTGKSARLPLPLGFKGFAG